jgi:hypothetical protein
MSNKNKTNSPLLEFVKFKLSYSGKKYIANGSLQIALDSINKKIDTCCRYINVHTEDLFLATFMFMLNSMDPEYTKAKLIAVRDFLQTSQDCC